ncbi:unnamed protein product [Malus baccata var. baccata]
MSPQKWWWEHLSRDFHCRCSKNVIERMYIDIDPEENTTLTVADLPIVEDLAEIIWLPHEIELIMRRCIAYHPRGDASIFLMIAFKMRGNILSIIIEVKHVQNKVKRLKDKYEIACNMMNTSGFGWDDNKKKCCLDTSGFAFYGFLLWKHLHATY